MSALATLLVRQGDTVTGADRTLGTPNIRFLESLGVRVFPDDGSGVDAATDEVIVSTAIEETNAGLVRAKEFGIPVTHRAKALSQARPFRGRTRSALRQRRERAGMGRGRPLRRGQICRRGSG